MILDDCLSAVDNETEQKIMQEIIKHKGKKTILLISHKLSSVSFADEIIVLDKGSIAEHGSHNQLIKNKGIYYEMYQQQKTKPMAI